MLELLWNNFKIFQSIEDSNFNENGGDNNYNDDGAGNDFRAKL